MPDNKLNSTIIEQSFLGTVLAYPKLFVKTIGEIDSHHFDDITNLNIFNAITYEFKNNGEFNIVSICQRLNDSNSGTGESAVVELTTGYYSASGLDGYMKTLDDKYKRRTMSTIGKDIHSLSTDTDIDIDNTIHSTLESVSNVLATKEDNSFDNVIDEIQDKIDEFKESDSDILGMPTGIHALDKMLEGIQAGQFIGFAAYTSQGKTWDALNIASNLINNGKKVCFITLENSKAQILSRLASINCGISDIKIKKGDMDDNKMLDVKEYMQKVVDSGSTVYSSNRWEDIKTAITKESLVNKPDIFILDYLQIITGEKDSVRLLEDVSGYLQNTLISVGIPMIALSQISNETAKGNTKDEVLKFKGSGAVGASVSTAIFKKSLHDREEIEARRQAGVPLESWWIIEKNRDGDYTGRIKTYFHPWSHKLWGPEEFEEEYGWDKYNAQLEKLGEEMGEDYKQDKKSVKEKLDDFDF